MRFFRVWTQMFCVTSWFWRRKIKTLLIECWQKWRTVTMWEYFVTSCNAVLTQVYVEPSNTPEKLMFTALVHENHTEMNKTSIDTNKSTEQKLRNIYIYYSELSLYDKSHKPRRYIMCNNLWLSKYIYIYTGCFRRNGQFF